MQFTKWIVLYLPAELEVLISSCLVYQVKSLQIVYHLLKILICHALYTKLFQAT